ncbi:hypothetical protein GALMADRAFT_247953 [Galerina marginata CBS 339.88]|uniref:MARVEL domain-containing protein n=1 Tax=Galerina marginata (strain CBS 339.88) TaxID=685588 RepID=A0A067SXA8_GALM3|nr:hypothetical protein GALMADRAFT_247953 [Galerina marginata CBS 339.88]
MIIAIQDSDAASTTGTLVTKEPDKLPRFFVVLTYISLAISLFPFAFSLIIVSISRLHSIPTIIAYVLSTPFHVAALLIIWQHSRQIDMQFPFRPSSWRSIGYICFLAAIWLFSMVTCALGAQSFVKTRICTFSVDTKMEVCDTHHYERTVFALIGSTALAVFEALILCSMAVVCYRSRPLQDAPPMSQSPIPSPKVLSA